MVVEIPVWQNVAIGGNNNNQLKQETKVQSMDTACGEVLNNPSGWLGDGHDELEGG